MLLNAIVHDSDTSCWYSVFFIRPKTNIWVRLSSSINSCLCCKRLTQWKAWVTRKQERYATTSLLYLFISLGNKTHFTSQCRWSISPNPRLAMLSRTWNVSLETVFCRYLWLALTTKFGIPVGKMMLYQSLHLSSWTRWGRWAFFVTWLYFLLSSSWFHTYVYKCTPIAIVVLNAVTARHNCHSHSEPFLTLLVHVTFHSTLYSCRVWIMTSDVITKLHVAALPSCKIKDMLVSSAFWCLALVRDSFHRFDQCLESLIFGLLIEKYSISNVLCT